MTNGYLFREYIGAQFAGVRFSDVPVNAGLSFNFILAFAIDYTAQATSPVPTNGVFSAFWDTANLSRADVAAAKAAHPNVSVMMAIGGASVQDIVEAVFTPTSVDTWVANAVASISALISEYGLDGVDVDYEHFGVGADVFVECIGRLLTQLKAKFPKMTTSIAPFEDPTIQEYYKALWAKYSGVIDYINFQFYGYGDNTIVDYYVQFYNDQLANYPGGKITPEQGISGAQELLRQNKLPGFFIFSADSSKQSAYGFQYETRAQEIVANH